MRKTLEIITVLRMQNMVEIRKKNTCFVTKSLFLKYWKKSWAENRKLENLGLKLSQSCSNVLCYMVILYRIYNIMLYDHTIWESYFNILCHMIWSSLVLPGAPWCSLAKWCEQGANRYKTTQNHSRPKLLCYIDILWMDLLYGIHCVMLPATYHTYILMIRASLPDTAPRCSLVLYLVFPDTAP